MSRPAPLDWWRRRRLAKAHAAIPAARWPAAFAALPLLQGLDAAQQARLRDLTALFLQQKTLEPVQGARLNERMALELALQATLPVLALGLDWYRGWHALILYPDEFVPAREVVDADGLVWIDDEPKSGEAWEIGPVILSLADAAAGRARDGYNVVIHEMAHKLDLRDGAANGHPPLHRGMSDAGWAADLGAAYEDLCRRAAADPDGDLPLDPYACESPAEFFAVASEAFFELPRSLAAAYPRVYAQLCAFYRQDPGQRLA
ncbi:MAG: zinc-dependent peptidase [Chromatiaceae bacterium]|nr:MAG: zinc-dependent peptidase [Chromatiaceae bacterium]